MEQDKKAESRCEPKQDPKKEWTRGIPQLQWKIFYGPWAEGLITNTQSLTKRTWTSEEKTKVQNLTPPLDLYVILRKITSPSWALVISSLEEN